MDPKVFEQLAAFFVARPWLVAGFLAVYIVTRLLRDDARFLPDLKGTNRMVAAMLLGVAAGVLEKFSSGVPLKDAAANGFMLGFAAIATHFGLVDILRGGKELPIPGFLQKPDEKKPDEPQAPSPPNIPTGLAIFAVALALCCTACGGHKPPTLTAAGQAEADAYDATVEECKDRARAVFKTAGKYAALDAYDACILGPGGAP